MRTSKKILARRACIMPYDLADWVLGCRIAPANHTRPRGGFFMPVRSAKWTPDNTCRWSYRNPKSCAPSFSPLALETTSETTAVCITRPAITPRSGLRI
jgi:hypothetical protein